MFLLEGPVGLFFLFEQTRWNRNYCSWFNYR